MLRLPIVFYLLIICCLSFLPKSLSAKNCLVRGNKSFCEGDRVVYPYPKSESQYYGVIEKVDPEIRNGNHKGIRWIRLDDGSILTDEMGYHTYFHLADLQECAVFSGQKVCVGETVPVMGYSGNGGNFGFMKVIAIAPEMFGKGYELYGPTKDWYGKTVLIQASEVPIVNGIVPKFPELQFGDSFPNAYGKKEKIILFDPEDKNYALESEGTNHLVWYKENELRIRYNQIKEYPIQWEKVLEEITDCYTNSCAKDVLRWRANLYLSSECENKVFGYKKSSTRDTTFEIEDFESSFEFLKYVGSHHMGGDMFWPIPRKKTKAFVKAKTICVSTETKEK
ncbi:hypothetical protein [Leptospira perdikensis]|uniref:Uncharacterized protein n=1 Tax=Leptospira perdikensis TaxID=2484948 RepID=A0A4R9JIE0_9LEPT|nr:hypothetical protein [Leptospira perdikensis]TGL41424.1 hypothetical protein EHQ49_07615 [Leptospira perdikensis]